MRYRSFGPTGLRISEFVPGSNDLRRATRRGRPAQKCARILDTYAEAGGTVADTAVNYRGGQNEEILGQLLKGQRDRFMLFLEGNQQAPVC